MFSVNELMFFENFFEKAQEVCDECCSKDMDEYSLEISDLIVKTFALMN